jgi:hypothetical protein
MQLLPPGFTPVFVLDPAGHIVQLLLWPKYKLTGHAALHAADIPKPLGAWRPTSHGRHADTVDTLEYRPAAHAMQLLPSALTPVSVLDPAGHTVQLAVVPAPAPAYDPAGHEPLHNADVPAPLSAYRPALQLEHPGTFDAVEYCPAAHAMQLLAPVPAPVSVREPAAQAMHEAAVPAPADAYEAAGHAPLHAAVVPAPLSAYRPALQLGHPGTFDAVEYCPAAHAMQLLAPVPVPVSVREPALHAIQLL